MAEVTLPDGTVIVARGTNHIDVCDGPGPMYSVRIYRHPDGYDCNSEGVPLKLLNGRTNWEALRRGPSATTDMEMAYGFMKEAVKGRGKKNNG